MGGFLGRSYKWLNIQGFQKYRKDEFSEADKLFEASYLKSLEVGEPYLYALYNWVATRELLYPASGHSAVALDELLGTYPKTKDFYVDRLYKDTDFISLWGEGGFGEYVLYNVLSNLEDRLFPDVSRHTLNDLQLKSAVKRGYVKGYPDRTFRPRNPVNRAEFVKMLMLAFEKEDGNVENIKKFSDVNVFQWYAKPLAKAVELGVVKGYPDGKMKPTNNVTMVEAVKMLMETNYPDEDFTPKSGEQWYSRYLEVAKNRLKKLHYADSLKFLYGDLDHEMTRIECVELFESVLVEE